MIQPGVHYDMSDEEYHQQHPWEEHYFSSSQFKDAIGDIQIFKEKYITQTFKKETPQNMQDAFDVGTVAHTAILEPDKLKSSYVKWKTGNRTGKVWDQFLKDNPGKLVLTGNMVKQAQNAIKGVKRSPIAMDILTGDGGQSEVSFFVEFFGLRTKVRADRLGRGFIGDLKTTTGNVRDAAEIQKKIKRLSYDLSAALYVDVVNACIEHFELDIPFVETFYWVFASKDRIQCQTYDAGPYLELGRLKYRKAIENILENEASGWEFPEKIIPLFPSVYELGDWKKAKPSTEAESKDDDADLL